MHCLLSVREAMKNIDAEVFVVDNQSSDDSCAMVRQEFPEVKLIANKDNVGFAKANNQAIKRSKGQYVLLLNPDTIVGEDCFKKLIAFMDVHPEAGGLGLYMADGGGNYLPESKRGFPTPWRAACKLFGLTGFFPSSKALAGYYLGHLSEASVQTVEVLAGAFMLMPKKVLDEVGILDESFFMYGEDIDLSYRIHQAGYMNYYLPDPKIIHYKGESSKRGSMNYVRIFYQAMIIFARKHFSQSYVRFYSLFIHAAIYSYAAFAFLKRMFMLLLKPLRRVKKISNKAQSFMLISREADVATIKKILDKVDYKVSEIRHLVPTDNTPTAQELLNKSDLQASDNVILNVKDFSYQSIIAILSHQQSQNKNIYIAYPDHAFIIGSNSQYTAGKVWTS